MIRSDMGSCVGLPLNALLARSRSERAAAVEVVWEVELEVELEAVCERAMSRKTHRTAARTMGCEKRQTSV